MTAEWDAVRALAAAHRARPFPDCRGEDIEGVELVLVDADLYGCVSHFLGEEWRTDEFQTGVLRAVTADLDRIQGKLPEAWAQYFAEAHDLAHRTLELVMQSGRAG